jgi:hypothetical protein
MKGVCKTFNSPYVRPNERALPQMLKKARHLTRPTPARQDAPFRGQGRSG